MSKVSKGFYVDAETNHNTHTGLDASGSHTVPRGMYTDAQTREHEKRLGVSLATFPPTEGKVGGGGW